jgi:hypothetical protein
MVGRLACPTEESDFAKAAALAFDTLQAEIKLCPRGVRPALEELCVEDRACPPGWLPAVKIALRILAVTLGYSTEGEPTEGEPTEAEPEGIICFDLRTPDEFEADTFLWGWGECTPYGLIHNKYFREGEDRDARAALLRVLRGDQPLSQTLRRRLADLFDDNSAAARRVSFNFRHRQNRTAYNQVWIFVERELQQHCKKEAALAAAQKQFGMSRKEVNRLLRLHREAHITKKR